VERPASSRERPLPVADVVRLAGRAVDALGLVWLVGEVTQVSQPSSGHVYFALQDQGSVLPAVMWGRDVARLRAPIQAGQRLRVRGRLGVYDRDGKLQLYADFAEPAGAGAEALALEQLKAKLAAEGLFAAERKRRLPVWPRAIGLVTGNDAAAKRDVLTGIQARFPPANVIVAETYVQGPRAASAVVETIRRLAELTDVIVVARGGGSFEDLLPFSDERLVRAIAACPVPVVSAVGHEQDMPLCDLAADVRASTPTAAARLVVPDLGELHDRLDRSRAALGAGARRSLDRHAQRLAEAHDRLRRAPALLLERRRATLEQTAGRLRALSPQATLNRGYAIVRAGESIVRSAEAVEPGERIDVEVGDGRFGARVE